MYYNMYRNANSCNMTNLISVQANTISLVQGNAVNDITGIFVENQRIKTATLQTTTNKYEYNNIDVNNTNVSELQSMIDYMKTHKPNTQPSISFEENNYVKHVKNISGNTQNQKLQSSITYE